MNNLTQYKPLSSTINIVDVSGFIIDTIDNNTTDSPAIIGQHVHDLFHDTTIDSTNCAICTSIKKVDVSGVFEVLRSDKYFDVHLSPYKVSNEVGAVLHNCYDVTRRFTAEKNLDLISRLYNMLRLANQAIFKHNDEHLLLQELCDIAISAGRFELSWFGVLEDNNVRPFVFGGKHAEYIKNINIDLNDEKKRNGPVAMAIRNNSIYHINDLSADEGFKPWLDRAEKVGIKSIVVMPWEKNGLPIGVFALYGAEVDAFDDETLDMVQNLSNDISHILKYMDAEKSRRAVERQLLHLSKAIDQSKSAIMITDMKLNIEYVNKFFCHISGIDESQLLGSLVFNTLAFVSESQKTLAYAWSIVRKGKSWEGDLLVKSIDGDSYWFYLTVAPVFSDDGEMKQVIWTGRDNTDLHNAQKTISELAFYDTLTKLPNRQLYYDNMSRAIRRAERRQTQFALLFFDIDSFKSVNDTMGHGYGDLLLQHMAQILTDNVRASDMVARLGGDEFTVILEDIESDQQVKLIAKNIIKALNKPAKIDGSIMSISTSIGACIYPVDGKDNSTLMKKADMAMYHAKDSGKNTLKIFDDSIAQDHIKREEIKKDIQQALAEDEFSLYFQPQMCLHSNQLIGVEVLLRWLHPTLGWIPPDEFIPVAENSDLIINIDKWVIKNACREMKALVDKGFPSVKLAINVSAVYFKYSHELYNTVKAALLDSDFPADLVQLEMTENTLIKDADLAVESINNVRKLGVSFAIDDFGTGYSSLAYIKRFPVDMIKIDRSFIADLEQDKSVRSIVEGVVNISHSLGLKVLAEGVENQSQLEHLRSYGCDAIQGFLYAKPMAAEDLYLFGQS